MTREEARVIADEQIAFWRARGFTADQVWLALGLEGAWAVEWHEVRTWMVRWLIRNPGRSEQPPIKYGWLPATRRLAA